MNVYCKTKFRKQNAGNGYDMVGVKNHGTDERVYRQAKPVV
jgi:hypothetical protein